MLDMSKITSLELWKSFLTKCPNLHSLELQFSINEYLEDPAEQALYIDPLVSKLHPSLQILKLDLFVFKEKHLCAIGENMPSLR